jgi:hypothetical protein
MDIAGNNIYSFYLVAAGMLPGLRTGNKVRAGIFFISVLIQLKP